MSIHIKTNYKLHNKGIEYPLIINSTITKEENNTIWIICTIPFPNNYPMTDFHRELVHKGIANLYIIYDNKILHYRAGGNWE